METKKKKSFLTKTPSSILALLTVIAAVIVLFGLAEGLGSVMKIDDNIGEVLAYIIYDILIAIGCFYIVKTNPKSVWYVPVICNAVGIIAAIVEPTFWNTSLWILICGGWALSIITSIIGAIVGKRKLIKSEA